MKKLFLGLLVAGVALSASAFTNVEKSGKTLLRTFYHINGQYVELASAPTDRQCTTNTLDCTVTLPDSSPAVSPIPEEDIDLYNPTTVSAEGTWTVIP